MNMLAIGLLALWYPDPAVPGLESVTIPVAAMVRRQRQDAVNDIGVWIQADLEQSADRFLKRRQPRRMPHRFATAAANPNADPS